MNPQFVIQTVVVDYDNQQQCEQLVQLLDSYARDPMGGGAALAESTKSKLPQALRAQPGAFSLLAMAGDEAVGLCNCFAGFSTFAAAPLINIHDIAVESQWRGKGIGKALLAAVEEEALSRGCCKITLEVLQENKPARAAYRKAGFAEAGLDPAMGGYDLWQKPLS